MDNRFFIALCSTSLNISTFSYANADLITKESGEKRASDVNEEKIPSSDICDRFDITGTASSIEPYGNGLINDTFKLITTNGEEFIIQKINTTIFNDPKKLTQNIISILTFIKEKNEKIKNGKIKDCKLMEPVLEPIPIRISNTPSYKNYLYKSGKTYWRMFKFVKNSIGFSSVEDNDMIYEAGVKFGEFLSFLDDFPRVNKLNIVLPKFHDISWRLEQLDNAIKDDKAKKVILCKNEINFVNNMRSEILGYFNNIMNASMCPLRVTHNDTKISNVLFDRDTKKGLCVVDLDTIMPGKIFFDFGDALRSIARSSLKNEKNEVYFDFKRFATFTKGFLSQTRGKLTQKELELLPYSPVYMSFMLGVRFLTDYLNGDIYFKISYPDHNLDRAHIQFELVKSQLEQYERINNYIRRKSCVSKKRI